MKTASCSILLKRHFIPDEWVLFLLCDTNGVMFSFSGKAIFVMIFLCCLVLCSNRLRWKLATIGSFFMVNCLVDSWYALQVEHLILAEEPRFSGLVNRSRQFAKEIGPVWSLGKTVGKSKLMSQKGSIVVETPWHDWQTTSDCNFPVKIVSTIQSQFEGFTLVP